MLFAFLFGASILTQYPLCSLLKAAQYSDDLSGGSLESILAARNRRLENENVALRVRESELAGKSIKTVGNTLGHVNTVKACACKDKAEWKATLNTIEKFKLHYSQLYRQYEYVGWKTATLLCTRFCTVLYVAYVVLYLVVLRCVALCLTMDSNKSSFDGWGVGG